MGLVWAGSSSPLWRVTPHRHRVSADPSLPVHSMTVRGKQKEHSPTGVTKQSTPRTVSGLWWYGILWVIQKLFDLSLLVPREQRAQEQHLDRYAPGNPDKSSRKLPHGPAMPSLSTECSDSNVMDRSSPSVRSHTISTLYYSCPQCGKGDVPVSPGPYLCPVCGTKCKED